MQPPVLVPRLNMPNYLRPAPSLTSEDPSSVRIPVSASQSTNRPAHRLFDAADSTSLHTPANCTECVFRMVNHVFTTVSSKRHLRSFAHQIDVFASLHQAVSLASHLPPARAPFAWLDASNSESRSPMAFSFGQILLQKSPLCARIEHAVLIVQRKSLHSP